jgi:hypothetical protein
VSIKTSSQPNGQLVAAPASPLTQPNSPAPLPGAKSRRPVTAEPEDTDRHQHRYRLHVIATNVADVVTSLGGLIVDRAMAGWDVTVAVDDTVDDRAIRILGARVAAAGSDGAGSSARPQVLAVAGDLFVTNEPVRRLALAARKVHATEVLLWGRRRPPNLTGKFVPVRHRPSAAAQVFKSHALAARGTFAAEPAEEGFYSMA